jgi:hypothetical protein
MPIPISSQRAYCEGGIVAPASIRLNLCAELRIAAATFVDDLAQQLLYALVQRGLFDLHEFASTDVVERIVHKIVAKLALPQPAVKPKQ